MAASRRNGKKLEKKYPGTVVADKAALKVLLCGFVDGMEEGSEDYVRFCDIAMTMTGVQKPEGGLSKRFAESAYWTGAGRPGDPLRASEHAKLVQSLLGGVPYAGEGR